MLLGGAELMQIHVVQSGQTLYGIARTYGISVADIASANQIDPLRTLVIGQALVIPITGMYYFVQPGDSLYMIGKRFGISYTRLAQINAIHPARPLHWHKLHHGTERLLPRHGNGRRCRPPPLPLSGKL